MHCMIIACISIKSSLHITPPPCRSHCITNVQQRLPHKLAHNPRYLQYSTVHAYTWTLVECNCLCKHSLCAHIMCYIMFSPRHDCADTLRMMSKNTTVRYLTQLPHTNTQCPIIYNHQTIITKYLTTDKHVCNVPLFTQSLSLYTLDSHTVDTPITSRVA